MLWWAAALAWRSAALTHTLRRASGTARVSPIVVCAAATGFGKSAGRTRILETPLTFARLTNSEFGSGSRNRLAYDPRELRANQWAMQSDLFWSGFAGAICWRRRLRRINHLFWFRPVVAGRVGSRLRWRRAWRVRCHRLEHLVVCRFDRRLLFAKPGRLSALKGVFGIARCAAREANFVADHGHDSVVGEPPLARTIIVQGITEP
jgi:hypothetical protein